MRRPAVGRCCTAVRLRLVPDAEAPRPGGQALVLLAASTGGPAAFAAVIGGLPIEFAAPVLLVQHIDASFSQGLCSWLSHVSELSVRLAQQGDALEAGTVLVAPAGSQMVVRGQRIALLDGKPNEIHCPSADALFRSVAEQGARDTVAAVLSGMGSDGADGLLALRNAGATTIAQDRPSSAVYGMPRAALERGGATRVLPLSGIAAAITAFVEQRRATA